MYNEYLLEARYDKCKSFYGKAKVQEANGKKVLISYNTQVCSIDADGFHRIWDDYSATTMRHVNEFLNQNGRAEGGKAFWDSCPIEPDKGILVTDLILERARLGA